jgi:hypothetical protein
LSHIIASIAWRTSVGGEGEDQAPQPERGARQRAGLTPASGSNTISCQRETPHSKRSGQSKILLTVITVSTATPAAA